MITTSAKAASLPRRIPAWLLAFCILGALISTAACDSGGKKNAAPVQAGPDRTAEVLAKARLLETGQENDRREAFRFLAQLGPEASPAIPVLIRTLNHTDAKMRRSAAQVLGRIGKPSVEPLLEVLAEATDPRMMIALADALGEVGEDGRDALVSLVPLLNEIAPEVRAAGCIAIGKIHGQKATGQNVKTIELESESLGDLARIIVGGDTSKDGKVAIREVNPPPGEVRQLLDQFIPTHDVGPLADEGKSKTVITINTGAGSNKDAQPALELLVQMLEEDWKKEVRAAAAQGIGHLGPGGSDAVKLLIKSLWDHSLVACNAAWALGEIGPMAQEAVPHLQQAVRRQDTDLQQAAFLAIKKISK